jgi:hypothetical protein
MESAQVSASNFPCQRFDHRHHHEQFVRVIGKRQETVALVEPPRVLVLCLDHHSHCANAGGVLPGSAQRIRQQYLPDSLTAIPPIASETRYQDRWKSGIARQPTHVLWRQFPGIDRVARKRVISENLRAVRQHENGCDMLPDILASLRFEVFFERFNFARKTVPVVPLLVERFENQVWLTDDSMVSANGLPQFLVRLRRIHQGLHENFAVPSAKLQ